MVTKTSPFWQSAETYFYYFTDKWIDRSWVILTSGWLQKPVLSDSQQRHFLLLYWQLNCSFVWIFWGQDDYKNQSFLTVSREHFILFYWQMNPPFLRSFWRQDGYKNQSFLTVCSELFYYLTDKWIAKSWTHSDVRMVTKTSPSWRSVQATFYYFTNEWIVHFLSHSDIRIVKKPNMCVVTATFCEITDKNI